MSHRALLAAAGQGKLYVEDVFSAYPYVGNGSTQTITNGVDLTKGGMVWIKDRASASYGHLLQDSTRGVANVLATQNNFSEGPGSYVTSFNSNGFSLASFSGANGSAESLASWTFRKSARFFDIITWTGDGTSNRQIPHALGIAPGMVTAKRRDANGDWAVWHRSATGDLYLDTTAAQTGSFAQITATSATTFSVSSNANILNATYVAYAWAHDPDTVNGIVQCGGYTGNGSASGPVINLGWEPQYILVKSASGTVGDWLALDNARGLGIAQAQPYLAANSSAAEGTYQALVLTANGFSLQGTSTGFNGSGDSYIYLAIRRGPMRTPTSGASVYNAIARTGTGAAATVTGVGFAPDLVMGQQRIAGYGASLVDRLRGRSQVLLPDNSIAEQASTATTQDIVSFDTNGVSLGTPSASYFNVSGNPEIDWFFRRAPGFMDEVCYTGNGGTQIVTHNLGVAPGMMWLKSRANSSFWTVYHQSLPAGQVLFLNNNSALSASAGAFNSTAPTSTSFTLGASNGSNGAGINYVAYLFGSVPGVSSIGSYTGNGATQTINCAFASGARFVLIKRTDAAGDWFVLDTVRGIISGNDPYLLLDSTAAEVTTADLLTPQSVGFGLTSNALVNANGGTFIYLAIA
jgi:hypothetical protein